MEARLLSDEDISAVFTLWKEAFPKDDEFWDAFKNDHFNPLRCIGLFGGKGLVSALYYFPCELRGRRFAYVFALATEALSRGLGRAPLLLEKSRDMLLSCGFSGALLCPQTEELFDYYKKHSYTEVISNDLFEADAANIPSTDFAEISPEEFLKCHTAFLPQGCLAHTENAINLFATYGKFAKCSDALFAFHEEEGRLICDWLLGNRLRAGDLLAFLGAESGMFKTAGGTRPFALALSFDGAPLPSGFGLELM